MISQSGFHGGRGSGGVADPEPVPRGAGCGSLSTLGRAVIGIGDRVIGSRDGSRTCDVVSLSLHFPYHFTILIDLTPDKVMGAAITGVMAVMAGCS